LSVDPAGLVYAWSVTKDGSLFAAGSGTAFTFTPDDNGTYVVSLIVTDAAGRVSPGTTVTLVVDNVAPAVSLGGPYTAAAGVPIPFAAVVTDPSPVDTAAGFSYLWDFGDGITSSLGTPDHVYSAAGIYTVTLIVTDKDGGQTVVTTTATVT
jgi:PKD repeat protein